MSKRKTCLKLTLALACLAAILWLAVGCQDPEYQCGTKSLERANKTKEVFDKYEQSLPNSYYVRQAFLRDEKTGERTKEWGIVITVKDELDQDSLPPEQRIPDEVEGVPVQVITTDLWYMIDVYQWEGRKGGGHFNYMSHVIRKNEDLFDNYPFSLGARMEFPEVRTEVEEEEIWGIDLWVSQKVHNLGLSPTARIPDCLEDIPVIITVQRPYS